MAIKKKSEDRFQQQEQSMENMALNAIAFARSHAMFLATGSGVVLLAGIIAAVYVFQSRRADARAAVMLLHAETPAQQETILNRYPSSSSAPIALLALASSVFHAGGYDRAYAYYEQFLEQYPAHLMTPTAELGKIMCQEALGRTTLALEGFSRFVAEHPDHYLVPQALFGKARCLQVLGRYADAKAIYEDYIFEHPDDRWTLLAESALTFLEMEARSVENIE